jgi:hypothetical protein
VRPDLRPENPTEWFALRFNLAPRPAGEAMFGMPMARSIMAGVRLGIFERLAKGPAGADELARELELTPAGTRLLLDSLNALGHVERDGSCYELTKNARRWLDPASETYVGNFIQDCFQYWEWWSQLEDVVRTGRSFELHDTPPEDPGWQTYIRGQFELARLSAPEVAKALRLPDEPTALLDVAGAHGWFSAELCRRHPGLRATVVDLPGSAAVGRQIVAEQGMSDRVEHREGDIVAELLRDVHPEPLPAVAKDDRAHPRKRPGCGQLVEVEIGQPSHQPLALDDEPGKCSGCVIREHALSAEALYGVRRVVLREEEAAVWREADQLLAGERLDEPEVAADLDLSVQPEILDDGRVDVFERPPKWRRGGARLAARRRQEGEGHERIRSPAES